MTIYVALSASYFLTAIGFSFSGVTISLAQVPIFVLFPILLKRVRIISKSLWILLIASLSGYLAYLEFGSAFNSFRFIHQLLGLFLVINVGYLVAISIRNNFHIYLKAYFAVGAALSLIGIIEEISYLIGYTVPFSGLIPAWQEGGTSNIFVRVSSLQSEPTHFAVTLIPLVVVSIYVLAIKRTAIIDNKFLERFFALIILVAFVLTFSTTGYLAFFIFGLLYWVFSLNFSQIGKRIFVALLIVAIFVSAYVGSTAFRSRLNLPMSQSELFRSGSHLAVISNLWLSKEILMRHPLLGAGLGNNPVAFQQYILPEYPEDINFYNQVSGASLILRYFNEGGLVLLILVLWLIFKGRLSFIFNFERIFQSADLEYRVILVFKYATLAGLFAYFIRRGLYVDLNFWVLVFLGKYWPRFDARDKSYRATKLLYKI